MAQFGHKGFERETKGIFYPSHDDDIIYMEICIVGVPPLSNDHTRSSDGIYLLMIKKSTFLDRVALLDSVEPSTRSVRVDWKDWFSSVLISKYRRPYFTLAHLGYRCLFHSPAENTITIRDYHAGRVNRARHLPASDSTDPKMKISHSHLTYDFDYRWLKNASELPSEKPAPWPYFEVTRSLPEGFDEIYECLLSDSAIIFVKVSTFEKFRCLIPGYYYHRMKMTRIDQYIFSDFRNTRKAFGGLTSAVKSVIPVLALGSPLCMRDR
jgi:hypothetical protein